jgi:outer membrane murein-binding lipoprotein Lpp
MGIRKKPEYI